MNPGDLLAFKDWFSGFSRSFYSADPEQQKNIALKVRHTFDVCGIITGLSRDQSISPDKILLMEASALFHDLGRFPQYARYRTFRDSISVNHGKLGADVLAESGILGCLPEHERILITTAVRFHNAFAIPRLDDPDGTHILKMVRDADKLDIWNIFLGFFEGGEDERASEAGLGLPDLPGYSEGVISDLHEKRTATIASLRTLNDFKLLQLSWIYDLNFQPSFRLLIEKDYIGRLIALLPATAGINRISLMLQEYASRKAKED